MAFWSFWNTLSVCLFALGFFPGSPCPHPKPAVTCWETWTMLYLLAIRSQTTPWIHDRSRVRTGVRPCFPQHLPLQQWQPSTACSATGPPSARQGPPCSPPPPPLWAYLMRRLPQPWDRCVAAGLSSACARVSTSKALLSSGTTSTYMPWFCVALQCWCRRTVASPAARALLWTHFFLELGQAAAPCLRPCGCPMARGGQQVWASNGGHVFLIPCTIHRAWKLDLATGHH